MKTATDYNSTINQEIKGKFIQREVLTCFSYEMDAILNTEAGDLPSWDDIENAYSFPECCPHCGEGLPLEEDMESDKCPDCEQYIETEPQEIFEWWIVTEYLYNKLKTLGEPVLEWGNNCYWGRCTTGQAILLDRVISEICDDMEILEGQKYQW